MMNHRPLHRCALAAVLAVAAGVAVSAADEPPLYAVDFVSTAASGSAMNDAGVVAGTSRRDTGCGSNCLPPLETVVWRNGVRIVLPIPPGFSSVTVRGINNSGWLAGFAGNPSFSSHAVVWKRAGAGYAAIDLGVFPGTRVSFAAGIDDLGRVVGFSTTTSIPPNSVAFLWTEAGGMVSLAGLGFPNQLPLFVGSAGTVATADFWYNLDDPASTQALAPRGRERTEEGDS